MFVQSKPESILVFQRPYGSTHSHKKNTYILLLKDRVPASFFLMVDLLTFPPVVRDYLAL